LASVRAMVRRRPLAKSASNSPNRRLASPGRWTSTEASVLTGAFFPSRTTASWIVVVGGAFRSDFGANDPILESNWDSDAVGSQATCVGLRPLAHIPANAVAAAKLAHGWIMKTRLTSTACLSCRSRIPGGRSIGAEECKAFTRAIDDITETAVEPIRALQRAMHH
jgi:hypothetical protein